MGKSFKKSPFDSIAKTHCGEEGKWKRSNRQSLRRKIRQVIDVVDECSDEQLERLNESGLLDQAIAGDVWTSPKEGKYRLAKHGNESDEAYEQRKRKGLKK